MTRTPHTGLAARHKLILFFSCIKILRIARIILRQICTIRNIIQIQTRIKQSMKSTSSDIKHFFLPVIFPYVDCCVRFDFNFIIKNFNFNSN